MPELVLSKILGGVFFMGQREYPTVELSASSSTMSTGQPGTCMAGFTHPQTNSRNCVGMVQNIAT
jgi:hypothetical protein